MRLWRALPFRSLSSKRPGKIQSNEKVIRFHHGENYAHPSENFLTLLDFYPILQLTKL